MGRYLIVCVLNHESGRRVLAELAESAPHLGLVWIGTLGEELQRAGVKNFDRADELPYCFALLLIQSGSEAQALRDVFRFECHNYCTDEFLGGAGLSAALFLGQQHWRKFRFARDWVVARCIRIDAER